ncbi:hypothetical protein F5B20DRAFT_571714 [Whalleya microplaca]|nr:hypothetical protein F5B20DRAFT_571714 [Whalleya microplaca]
MATPTYAQEYLAESRVLELNILYSLPIPLEILSTAFRLWLKAKPSSQGHLAFDDYLMVWATISAVAVCIAGLVYGPPKGLGRHIQAVPEADVEGFLMGDYIFSHFYDVAIASTKLSVLALYYRIFVTSKFRIFVISTVVVVLAWLASMEIVLGLGCRPIQGWWNAEVAASGACVNKVAFTYSTNITNLITDVWIFVMPIPIILGLQASMDKRIGLCFLFSVGLGTCAISAARLSVVVSVGSDDITWDETPLGILSAWEPCGGILCANLPLIYRAMLRGLSQIRSTVRSSRSRSHDVNGQLYPHNSLYHDWTELNNNTPYTPPEVSVTRGSPCFAETDVFAETGIKVKHGFRQEVYRHG